MTVWCCFLRDCDSIELYGIYSTGEIATRVKESVERTDPDDPCLNIDVEEWEVREDATPPLMPDTIRTIAKVFIPFIMKEAQHD